MFQSLAEKTGHWGLLLRFALSYMSGTCARPDAMFDLRWHGLAKVKLGNNTGPDPAIGVRAASLEKGFGPQTTTLAARCAGLLLCLACISTAAMHLSWELYTAGGQEGVWGGRGSCASCGLLVWAMHSVARRDGCAAPADAARWALPT